jgi:DnaB-like helicase C terminal domain
MDWQFLPSLSGLPRLDRLLAGHRPGKPIVILGRPSTGRTTLALAFACYHAAHRRHPTLVFTGESSERLIGGVRAYLRREDWPTTLSTDPPRRRRNRDAGHSLRGGDFLLFHSSAGASVLDAVHVIGEDTQFRAVSGCVVIDLTDDPSGPEHSIEASATRLDRQILGLLGLARQLPCPLIACLRPRQGTRSRNAPPPKLSTLLSTAERYDSEVITLATGHRPVVDFDAETLHFWVTVVQDGRQSSVRLCLPLPPVASHPTRLQPSSQSTE